MPKLTEDDERKLVLARELMDRYGALFSLLTQGENSPYMTEAVRQRLAEAEKKLAPYTITGRATQAE